MTKGVIDGLEVVEIDQEDQNRLLIDAQQFDQPVQTPLQPAPVQRSGEGVGYRQLLQRVVRVLQSRNVEPEQHHTLEQAVGPEHGLKDEGEGSLLVAFLFAFDPERDLSGNNRGSALNLSKRLEELLQHVF